MVYKYLKFIILFASAFNLASYPYARAATGCTFTVDTGSSLTTSLTDFFPFDEVSGNRTGNSADNVLTDVNTVASSTGILSNAASFTAASSERLDAPNNTLFDVGTGDFSVSFWVKGDNPASGVVLFAKRIVATGQGYYANINASDQIYFNPADENGTDFDEYRGSTDIATGAWFNVVITWNGSTDTGAIFVNGTDETVVLTNDADGLGSLTNTIVHVMGSQSQTAGSFLDEELDEYGFWSKVLTSTEISNLYNSGNANSCGAGGGGRSRRIII